MLWLVITILVVGAWIAASYFMEGVNQRRLNRAVLGFIVLWTLGNSITVIPAGTVGVKDFFGEISDKVLHPGMRVINPMLTIHRMSVRTQEIKETARVPSSEGLIMDLDASALFNLNPTKAPEVYRTLGTDYVGILIEPQLRSHIRDATASFEAKALYTAGRELIAEKILRALSPVFEEKGFINLKILPRSIGLPTVVASAIEQKLKAEQESEQMKFVLQRERQEAERKKIEASGIAAFQTIVSQGISKPLLAWKGIEATKELARSTNAKIVIIGAGENGLPIILNTAER